jgi:hypothetical protein
MKNLIYIIIALFILYMVTRPKAEAPAADQLFKPQPAPAPTPTPSPKPPADPVKPADPFNPGYSSPGVPSDCPPHIRTAQECDAWKQQQDPGYDQMPPFVTQPGTPANQTPYNEKPEVTPPAFSTKKEEVEAHKQTIQAIKATETGITAASLLQEELDALLQSQKELIQEAKKQTTNQSELRQLDVALRDNATAQQALKTVESDLIYQNATEAARKQQKVETYYQIAEAGLVTIIEDFSKQPAFKSTAPNEFSKPAKNSFQFAAGQATDRLFI